MGWDAPWHWVVLAIIVIALFGYKKLPDAARSVGRSLRIFKTEIKGMSEDDKKRDDAAAPKQLEAQPAVAETAPAQPLAQPVAAPVSQPAAEPVSQPVSPPVSQPLVSQPPVSQPPVDVNGSVASTGSTGSAPASGQ